MTATLSNKASIQISHHLCSHLSSHSLLSCARVNKLPVTPQGQHFFHLDHSNSFQTMSRRNFRKFHGLIVGLHFLSDVSSPSFPLCSLPASHVHVSLSLLTPSLLIDPPNQFNLLCLCEQPRSIVQALCHSVVISFGVSL